MVDEAHSFGLRSARSRLRGRSSALVASTSPARFSKTLAAIGGFCISNHDELKLLHFAARTRVFCYLRHRASAASKRRSSAAAGAVAARLWSNVRRARAGLRAAGFDIGAAGRRRVDPSRSADPAVQFLATAARPPYMREPGAAAGLSCRSVPVADQLLAAHSDAEIDRVRRHPRRSGSDALGHPHSLVQPAGCVVMVEVGG
jgi:8-amino-7-oxononanoate synthase